MTLSDARFPPLLSSRLDHGRIRTSAYAALADDCVVTPRDRRAPRRSARPREGASPRPNLPGRDTALDVRLVGFRCLDPLVSPTVPPLNRIQRVKLTAKVVLNDAGSAASSRAASSTKASPSTVQSTAARVCASRRCDSGTDLTRCSIRRAGPFAALWQEYARADSRWGTSDATVVSIELITVLGAGPLCVWLMDMMRKGNPAWRYWM